MKEKKAVKERHPGVEVVDVRLVTGDGKLKGFADVRFTVAGAEDLDGELVVKGFSILEGKQGAFVAMPRKASKDGRWFDVIEPNEVLRVAIEEGVMESYRKELGATAMDQNTREELAFHELRRLGYKVLLRNYECSLGEVHIIAKKEGRLVFLMVDPDEEQAKAVKRVAKYYVKRYGLDGEVWMAFETVNVVPDGSGGGAVITVTKVSSESVAIGKDSKRKGGA